MFEPYIYASNTGSLGYECVRMPAMILAVLCALVYSMNAAQKTV